MLLSEYSDTCTHEKIMTNILIIPCGQWPLERNREAGGAWAGKRWEDGGWRAGARRGQTGPQWNETLHQTGTELAYVRVFPHGTASGLVLPSAFLFRHVCLTVSAPVSLFVSLKSRPITCYSNILYELQLACCMSGTGRLRRVRKRSAS